MNSVILNNLSLKCQRFTTLGCKDIGIRKSEFVAKTHFLCSYFGVKSKLVEQQGIFFNAVAIFRMKSNLHMQFACQKSGLTIKL